ncbi:unnamed protein product [Notodromas monacha]|uniref:Alpha-1,4-N-acetylglucosaminyltransferase n=1 Tax=Notodromas monacha TaxID=399045 RepID=A0A7R9GB20_9CRUS|nr:unnamed protein product [Notodromas monacha]CAG0915856.1 unnamed protein product [Notodromas monacha]
MSWQQIPLPYRTEELEAKKLANQFDVLRYVTLFKYGGLYLDTDVIVMKPMDDLVNALGLQGPTELNGGVLAFEKHHPFIEACLKEVSERIKTEQEHDSVW